MVDDTNRRDKEEKRRPSHGGGGGEGVRICPIPFIDIDIVLSIQKVQIPTDLEPAVFYSSTFEHN